MTEKDIYTAPHRQYGYDPRDEPGIEPEEKRPPLSGSPSGEDNRGRRAAVTQAGEVIGSGAGAGGKGAPEDFDSDPQSGDGTFVLRHDEAKPDKGGDASQHNST